MHAHEEEPALSRTRMPHMRFSAPTSVGLSWGERGREGELPTL